MDPEPSTVITVRLPKSLHERAKEAASKCPTSLNMFCVYAIEDACEEMEKFVEREEQEATSV